MITYITAGDPSPGRTPELVAALERGGADLIELGVPFSDPIADGPVIQRGSERALKAGTTVAKVLDIAADIRKHLRNSAVAFHLYEPGAALRSGRRSPRDAVASGIDGCLLTDLSVEEAEPYVGAMRNAGLDTVFLAAPTSTQRRLELVAKYSSGFVYLVSRTGVTGERATVSDAVAPLVSAMRNVTDLPLAVGFGISTADQVRTVGAIADGVAVGTAVVRVVEQNAASRRLPDQAGSPGPRTSQWFTIEESMSMEKLAECRKQIDVLDREDPGAAERADARCRGDRPHQTESLAAHLRAEARRSSVPQHHHPQSGAVERGGSEPRLRAHHRRNAHHPARQDAVKLPNHRPIDTRNGRTPRQHHRQLELPPQNLNHTCNAIRAADA